MNETEILCGKLGIDYQSIPFSQNAYNFVYYFVHYYRLKRVQNAYVHQKPYHSIQYLTFPYDYDSIYQNKLDPSYLESMILDVRTPKNRMLNNHIANYRFFYHDRNIKMFYITKNLIKHYFYYYEMMINESNLTQENENNCVQNLLRAYFLFSYVQSQEIDLSRDEFDRLINEKWHTYVK